MTTNLPFSQACENNKAPILERLREIFEAPGKVLEVGTGTGQHAVHFARAMPHLQWQPTDHPDAAHIGRPRLEQATLPNILPMIELDVGTPHWPVDSFRWAFSANTAHIMAWNEVEQMFQHIGERLIRRTHFIAGAMLVMALISYPLYTWLANDGWWGIARQLSWPVGVN